MDKTNLFYERLLKAVEQSGKSVNCIERELGYSRNELHNYKNGTAPSGSRLIELAQYFHLSPDYLIGKDDATDYICPESFFQKLNKEQKIKMLKIAQKWATRQIIKPDFEIKQMKKKN
ncbi:XRE family transcriptional regulator [Lactococcus lactis]|uniref:helix-turn-helix domain-containing protein n=1 Tax=Lactococcus lactis TaxID=1358 RepID=UPI00223B5F93|nr:helix-turn-helix transcriptional regulator [Lactococcus lactis]MCT1182738.1 XRE family transcriptional regulator [Lactococcus lactis]